MSNNDVDESKVDRFDVFTQLPVQKHRTLSSLEQYVRVFEIDSSKTTWLPLGDPKLNNGEICQTVSMSINGTVVAVGFIRNGVGVIRVFQIAMMADGIFMWEQLGEDILGDAGDNLSELSVSLSSTGRRLAFGAPNQNANGVRSGMARVYNFDGHAWTKIGKDINGNGPEARSGYSVSLSGDGQHVAIGSPHNSGVQSIGEGTVGVYKLACGDEEFSCEAFDSFGSLILDHYPSSPVQESYISYNVFKDDETSCRGRCADFDTLSTNIADKYAKGQHAVKIAIFNASVSISGNIAYSPLICIGPVADSIAKDFSSRRSTRFPDSYNSYICNNVEWKVGQCADLPGICAGSGCENPCSDLHRNFLVNCRQNDNDNAMNAIIFDFKMEFCTQNNDFVTTFTSEFPLYSAERFYYSDVVVDGLKSCGTKCDDWLTFTTTTLADKIIDHNVIESVTLVINAGRLDEMVSTCSGSIAHDMISELTKVSTRYGNDFSEFQCETGMSWKVGHCSSGLPVVCFNCSNPCVESDHDQIMSCYQGGERNVERLLVIDVSPLASLPEIMSTRHIVSNTAVVIEMEIVNAGDVVCAAFPSSSSFVPDSSYALLALGSDATEITTPRTNVTIDNLNPVTSYQVYCATISVSGQHSFIMENSTIETLCCQEIVITPTSSPLIDHSDLRAGLTIDVGNLPDEGEDIRIEIVSDPSNAFRKSTLSILSTNDIVFFHDSDPIKHVNFIKQISGEICFSFKISGSSRALFKLSMSRHCFTVHNSSQAIGGPQLASAMFSSDGTSVQVKFDSPTDAFDSSAPMVHDCSTIFSGNGINNLTKCMWVSDYILNIFMDFLDDERNAVVGDELTVLSNVFKAKCTVSDCSSWEFSSKHSILLTKPPFVIVPDIQLLGSDTIHHTKNFVLEFLRRDGHRAYKVVDFAISFVAANNSAERGEVVLNAEDYPEKDLSQPLTILNQFLKSGYKYNINLRVCSFLDTCRRFSHHFFVTSAEYSPVVALYSTSTVKSGSDLVLRAYVLNSEEKHMNSSHISFTWTAFRGTDIVPSSGFISTTSSIYVLKSSMLSPGTTYKFIVKATHMLSGVSSFARKFVYIEKNENVGKLTVSDNVDMNRLHNLLIEYEDEEGNTGSETGLVFKWHCELVWPIKNDARCSELIIERSDAYCAVSVLNKTDSSVDSKKFRITGIANFDGRSERMVTTLTITPPHTPTIEKISTRHIGGSGRTGNKVEATAFVISSGGGRVYMDDINMKKALLSPPSQAFPPSDSKFPINHSFSVILYQPNLPQQGTYNLEFKVENEIGLISSSSILVNVNLPPIGGSIRINPTTGDEMTTLFTLLAYDIKDDDLPLKHTFYFCSPAFVDSCQPINSFPQYSTMLKTIFGAGPQFSDYMKEVGVIAIDDKDASSKFSTHIRILPNWNVTIDDWLTTLNSQSNSELRGYISPQLIDISNRIHCDVSSCIALNRQNCAFSSNTCGLCLDGFNGQQEPANTMCIPEAIGDGAMTLSRQNVAEGSASLRDESTFFKACHPSCEKHGVCVFVSDLYTKASLERFLSECDVLDDSCQAQCICEVGFKGQGCEQTLAEFNLLNERYRIIFENWGKQISDQYPFPTTVVAWLSGIASVAPHASYLSQSSTELLIDLCLLVLRTAKDINISHKDIQLSVQKILNIASNLRTSGIKSYAEVLVHYQELFLESFHPIQYPETLYSGRSQFYVESFDGEVSTTTTMPTWGGISVSFGTVRSGKVAVAKSQAVSTERNKQTTPFSITLGGEFVHKANEPYHVNVTIRKKNINESIISYKTKCTAGAPRNITYQCPTPTNLKVTCNGKQRGYYVSNCSYFNRSVTCDSLSEGGHCSVIESTEFEVVFRCRLPASTSGLQSLIGAATEVVTIRAANSKFYNEGSDSPLKYLIWIIVAACAVVLAMLVRWMHRPTNRNIGMARQDDDDNDNNYHGIGPNDHDNFNNGRDYGDHGVIDCTIVDEPTDQSTTLPIDSGAFNGIFTYCMPTGGQGGVENDWIVSNVRRPRVGNDVVALYCASSNDLVPVCVPHHQTAVRPANVDEVFTHLGNVSSKVGVDPDSFWIVDNFSHHIGEYEQGFDDVSQYCADHECIPVYPLLTSPKYIYKVYPAPEQEFQMK
jgi:hypothetical protein